ncbi:hypothetical protein AX17_005458 [Amanita inopinata Kibby_2008]|nr:hypothetical protein AX17_005458 [Amanita inopinata Kibby_2008]
MDAIGAQMWNESSGLWGKLAECGMEHLFLGLLHIVNISLAYHSARSAKQALFAATQYRARVLSQTAPVNNSASKFGFGEKREIVKPSSDTSAGRPKTPSTIQAFGGVLVDVIIQHLFLIAMILCVIAACMRLVIMVLSSQLWSQTLLTINTPESSFLSNSEPELSDDARRMRIMAMQALAGSGSWMSCIVDLGVATLLGVAGYYYCVAARVMRKLKRVVRTTVRPQNPKV